MLKQHAVKNNVYTVSKPLINKVISHPTASTRLAAYITVLSNIHTPLIKTTKSYLSGMAAGIYEHLSLCFVNLTWAQSSIASQRSFKQGLGYHVLETAQPQVKRTAIAER